MSPVVMLTLAVLALAGGPGLALLTRRVGGLDAALHGFVVVTVGILVLGGVMPAAVAHAGGSVVAVMLAGFAVPLVFERFAGARQHDGSVLVMVMALLGLLIHVAFDGLALATDQPNESLLVAVMGHRLPVGLAVWVFVVPRFGPRWAAGVLALLGVATVVGFLLGARVTSGDQVHWVQAFVSGTLLHVLAHRPEQRVGSTRFGLVGVMAAIVFVILLPSHGHDGHSGPTYLQSILHTAAVVAVPLLLGLALSAGLLWLRPERRVPFDEEGGGADGAILALALAGPMIVFAWVLSAYAQLRRRTPVKHRATVKSAFWQVLDARMPWLLLGVAILALTPSSTDASLTPAAGLVLAVALGFVLVMPSLGAVFFALILGRLTGSAAVVFAALMLLPVHLRGRQSVLHLILTAVGTVLFWVRAEPLQSLAWDRLLIPLELGVAVVGALVLASLVHQGPIRFAESLAGEPAGESD